MGRLGSIGMVILSLMGLLSSAQAQLKLGFDSRSCSKAEKIVLDYVNQHIPNAPSLPTSLLRMHFHDCFVRGCDEFYIKYRQPDRENCKSESNTKRV